ncbi:hypothetical protein MtrunA17_Chr7g0249791 [Medicago truncatula]|uniref:Uncharacterized protein n=1 Tax=Medicago truncatula TaxID=3880 RepID=A0A396H1C3_MEDTR|nr:hypothetical protein MtrunA17_Chr7g0249791 [Medicago truncatula]
MDRMEPFHGCNFGVDWIGIRTWRSIAALMLEELVTRTIEKGNKIF